MRWKQAVTAEEVALYAFDLEGYKTLEKAKKVCMDDFDCVGDQIHHEHLVAEAEEL